MTKKEAYKIRKQMEVLAKDMSDDDVTEFPRFLPLWETDKDYSVGDRVRYDGLPYKCLQAHKSQETWTPSDAVSLWARIINEGIPDWVQPDATNPYMKGDKVRFDGKVYESLIDNNVWSPANYPAGWKEI